jgi:hypothetical protein
MQRLVRAATGPKPIREALEVHLMYLFENGRHSLLNNFVLQCRSAATVVKGQIKRTIGILTIPSAGWFASLNPYRRRSEDIAAVSSDVNSVRTEIGYVLQRNRESGPDYRAQTPNGRCRASAFGI